jgi:hypothetical protein
MPLVFILGIKISNAQNVGIGTSSPLEKLHISNGQIRLSRTASYNNNVIFNMPASQLAGEHEGLQFQLLGVEKAFIGYTSTSTSGNFLRLSGAGVNNNDLVINSVGNVGIGINTPEEKLHIEGNLLLNATNPTLQLQNDGINKGFLQLAGDNIRIGTNSGNTAGKFIIRNNGADRVFVDDNGNTGIGVTDPAAKLHINSGTSIEALRITGNDATIIRMMTGGTDKANIYATGNDLNISTVQDNGLLRLNGEIYINNTANRTGIGTTTPDERLHVSGNVKVSTGKVLNNDNYNMLPIAYGKFSSSGTRLSGTPNITASQVTVNDYQFFVVSVAGVNLSDAVASVTDGFTTITGRTISVEVYDSDPSKLKVAMRVGSDWARQAFHIIIYKP